VDATQSERSQIIVAGLRRFYSEGFHKWNEDNATRLFVPSTLDSQWVQDLLTHWERRGAISLPRSRDGYFILLDPDKLDNIV
jgi:hypothetical protein